jgi:hypothetical protein
MTDASAAAEPAPHDLRAARAERRLQRLDQLADMGVEVAGELRRQIVEQAGPAPELALAFDRVCRAVRLAQLLQEKLEREDEERAFQAAAEAAAQRASRVEARVKTVRRTVRGVLDVETEPDADGNFDDIELLGRMLDRVDREAEDARFLDRPLGEIVARICFDLGLQPDWSLWEDAPWAADAAHTELPADLREPQRRSEPPSPDDDPQASVADVLRRIAAERGPP